MANYLGATVGTLVSGPVTVVRTLIELPAALERNLRATQDLLDDSHEQLRLLREQAAAMLEQMADLQKTARRVEQGSERLAAVQAELEALVTRLGEAAEPRAQRAGGFFRRSRTEPRQAPA